MFAGKSASSVLLALLAIGVSTLNSANASNVVTSQTTTVNGLSVIRFAWTDSHGFARTVSIKQEGNGNPGHGGYAVQFTYVATVGGVRKTVVVNPADNGEGFGYFVSHEVYRTFTDGDNDTIANKIFHVDDSPLGRGIAASLSVPAQTDRSKGSIVVTTQYHHYGTVDPIPKDSDGNDVRPTPTAKAQLANYVLPVGITWVFQSGKDYPLIRTRVNLRNVGPDLVNFDVRGPYGAMFFNPSQATIGTVMWGDRYKFINRTSPITRNSSWAWNVANSGARYSAQISGTYEMGLLEPRPFSSSLLADGYSDGRGVTNGTYTCTDPDDTQRLPCDYEWPYQSVQYSLPYNNRNGTTNYPKMAWGSAPFYGSGTSLRKVYDTSTSSEPFNGHAGSVLGYDVCVVLGQTISGGLTAAAAQDASTYNCATP